MRLVRQVDATDCGPAALAMILSHWGRLEPLHRLRELSGSTQAGTTLWGLKRAAEQLGMDAKGLEIRSEDLSALELPALLHWEGNHYVVLEKLGKRSAGLLDPAQGRVEIKLEDLQLKFTGKALWLQPNRAFERGQFTGQRGLSGLLAHLRQYQHVRWLLLELGVATLLLTLLNLAAPLLSQVLFDRVLAFRQADLLPVLLIGIFAVTGLQVVFGAARNLFSGRLTINLNRRLRLHYLDHLMHLPMRVHETRLVGDLVTRFADLGRVRAVLSSLLVRVPSTLLSLILSLALLLSYNPWLALVALMTVPVQVAYLVWLAPRLRQNSRASRQQEGEVQTALLTSLEGLWTLKAFRSEPWATQRVGAHIDQYLDLSWKGTLLSNSSQLAFGLIEGLGAMLVLWFGAMQVLQLRLSPGQMVAAYALVERAFAAIAQVVDSISSLQEGIVASDRLSEMLELSPEATLEGQSPLPRLQQALRVEGLHFAYLPERPVLTGLSFAVKPGSYTAVLGANGSGKSTLAALLSRMLEPSAGRILWDGKPLRGFSLEAVRERILYLRQEVPVFQASLAENLCLGRDLDPERLLEALEAVGFGRALSRLPLGLETVIGGSSPYRLSSGERQMLGLARALLSNAEVLILDEPTAALDQDREQRVVGLLERLRGKKTLLVITHRPALIQPADQMLYLEPGRMQRFLRKSRHLDLTQF